MNLDFLKIVDDKAELLRETADYVWAHPETAYKEYESSAYLIDVLRKEGFEVTEKLAGIETAFSGRFGSGKPVIGLLGEYDALPNLGQAAELTQKCPSDTTNGHGCQHNLLGTGALGAAIALKHFLEEEKCSGTVVFFGCPAEEGGSAKGFMARDGVFDELDAALTWHPDEETGVRTKMSLANYLVLYKYDGKAAHAGAYPHHGRSALDAVELMNVGVNYLREHIIPEARIHYSIIDAGGRFPNVVQAHAEVLYMIRAPHNKQLKDIYERVNNIAEGAALMTGTSASRRFIKACSNTVLNDTLQQVLYDKMLEIGSPAPTPEEEEYARKLTLEALMEYDKADAEHPLHWEISPYVNGTVTPNFGSTDVGDVSWVCPTAQAMGATYAHGTPGHSWQTTTQGKTTQAHAMTRFISKSLAAAGAELMMNPEVLAAAKAEHERRVGPDGYVAPIPKGIIPCAVDDI